MKKYMKGVNGVYSVASGMHSRGAAWHHTLHYYGSTSA